MTIKWCMVPEILSVIDRLFCHYGQFFAHLPPKNPKNHNFEKMKKRPGDIIILHKCTKNHDHMPYCSWDMAHDRCNCYFSFWTIFCPFTTLKAQKIKISQKWKIPLEITSFYICVPKIMIRWQIVPEKWCVTDGRTDRRKKWHIEVGAPPKNHNLTQKQVSITEQRFFSNVNVYVQNESKNKTNTHHQILFNCVSGTEILAIFRKKTVKWKRY